MTIDFKKIPLNLKKFQFHLHNFQFDAMYFFHQILNVKYDQMTFISLTKKLRKSSTCANLLKP